MCYFWNDLESFGEKPALISEEERVSYRALTEMADRITENIPERSFVFLMCKNQMASIAGYIGFLRKRVVTVLLNASMDKGFFENLMRIYQPQWIWCPNEFFETSGIFEYGGYKLVPTGYDPPKMHDELAMMVTTSGSTGSPKLVRLSYQNIQANTTSIVEFLGILPEDRAITTLPMNYVYGLSIIQTHLMAGASIIITEKSFFEPGFWSFFKENAVSTFGAVPYLYQMLDKLRFLNLDLPSLRTITQAGETLKKALHERLAKGMREKGKSFIAMYGASEATARMGYVPEEMAVEKAGSIGIAIPGGRFELMDANGSVISENDKVGELVYYGQNVMLGYAHHRKDLNQGDDMHGRFVTGDLAKRDADGYYYLVGRKNRFLKIFGNRVNLAEVEGLLSEKGIESACVGEDDHLRIYTTALEHNEIIDYLSKKTGLNGMAFSVTTVEKIPRNQAGKILYAKLQ